MGRKAFLTVWSKSLAKECLVGAAGVSFEMEFGRKEGVIDVWLQFSQCVAPALVVMFGALQHMAVDACAGRDGGSVLFEDKEDVFRLLA
jgi:hypothetical protein